MKISRKSISFSPKQTRSDSTLKALKISMARKSGVPRCSVKIVAPDGRTIRSDATVGYLRELYK